MSVIEKLNSIKNGEITAKENVESFIKVIDENNEEINAFIELNYENALKQAEAIDEKIANGEDVGALAGLVFGIKANINVEDLTISAASKTLENYLGSYNATVVNEILAEDGIIIGILNMDEFAAGSSTETSYYGPTQNPALPTMDLPKTLPQWAESLEVQVEDVLQLSQLKCATLPSDQIPVDQSETLLHTVVSSDSNRPMVQCQDKVCLTYQ